MSQLSERLKKYMRNSIRNHLILEAFIQVARQEHTICWLPFVDSHRFICVTGPGGGCSAGKYPSGYTGGGQIVFQGSCREKSQNKTTCQKISSDCGLAANVCACVKTSIKDPGLYIPPFDDCYTYVGDMMQCACDKIKTGISIIPGLGDPDLSRACGPYRFNFRDGLVVL